MADRAEQLLEAVDLLFSQRIKSINFDSTIVCTIEDASKADLGQYTVSDGSVKFIAYSKETDYKQGDQVLVTIPNGDYNQQKVIVGKYVMNQNEPYTYVNPFSTIIDITHNLILGDQGSTSIYANDYYEYANGNVYRQVEEDEAWQENEYYYVYNSNLGRYELIDVDGEFDPSITYYVFVPGVIWSADYSSNPIVGYNRLGIQASFSTWLQDYDVIAGNYGIGLRVDYDKESLETDRQKEIADYERNRTTEIANITNAYQGPINAATEAGNTELANSIASIRNLKIDEINEKYDELILEVNQRESTNSNYYFLDSSEDFYGNIYGFGSYFQQEAVFDITDNQNKKIIGLTLFLYQRQNFVCSNGQYLPAPTFTANDLAAAMEASPDINSLRDYYHSDSYEYPDLDFMPNQVPNIYMKEPYICFGYTLDNFDSDELVLYTGSTVTYDTANTDEENEKTVELRWVHTDGDKTWGITTADFSGTTDFDDYTIKWYKYKLGAPSPDEYAGVFWETIATYRVGSIVKLIDDEPNPAFSDIFLQILIPDTTLAQEQIKAILIKDGGVVARSNILSFQNKQEVLNKTQADIDHALTIICGLPAEAGSGKIFDIDEHNGAFFLYQKGNDLIDEAKSKELFSLSINFNSLKDPTVAAGSYAPLTEASAVIWSFPASNSMIKPVYGSTEFTFLSKKMAGTMPATIEENWFSNPDHIRYEILSQGTTKAYYNSTLDTIEIVHTGGTLGILNTNINSPDSIFGRYFIEKTYSPAKVNNTVKCEIVKDRISYVASRQLMFGQSGTSGSDYTIVIDWRNNQNVLTIQNPSGGTNFDYGIMNPYYAMVPTVRLVGQDGFDVLDFNDVSETAQVNFRISQSETLDHVHKVVPVETESIFYPVYWTDMPDMPGGLTSDENQFVIEERWSDYENDEQAWNAKEFYTFVVDKYGLTDISNVILADKNNFHKVAFSERNTIYNNYRWLYRKLTPEDSGKIKMVYVKLDNLTSEENYNSYARDHLIFILYDGIYVVDPFGEYNEAQTYFTIESAEATETTDNYKILTCSNVDPADTSLTLPRNSCWITVNTNFNFAENISRSTAIMNSLSILEVTISGFGDYDLVTYYPIPLRYRLGDIEYKALTGATTVQYGTDGSVPSYYKNPYSLTYVEDNVVKESIVDSDNYWRIFIPSVGSNTDPAAVYAPTLTINNVLSPLPMYIPDAPLTGVQYIQPTGISWTQPILIYQDNFPSTTINKWDGKSIDINESTGTILSSAIAAGKKDKNNKFSGVMLGDWSRTDASATITKQTGLYGFHHGSMSYAFKEDGTGFIGRDGSGRINFSGDKSQLYSSDWINRNQGMLLDLDDGYMKLVKKSAYTPISFINRLVFKEYLEAEDNLPLYEFNVYDVFANYSAFESERNSEAKRIYYPSTWASLGLTTIAENNLANGNLEVPDNHTYYVATIVNNSNKNLLTYPQGQNYILLETEEHGGTLTQEQINAIRDNITASAGQSVGETYRVQEEISAADGYCYTSTYTSYRQMNFREYKRDNTTHELILEDGEYVLLDAVTRVVCIYQNIESKYKAINPAGNSSTDTRYLTEEFCTAHEVYRPIMYSILPSSAYDNGDDRFDLTPVTSLNFNSLSPYLFRELPETERYSYVSASQPFEPFSIYYQKANIEGNRFVTLGVNESIYPFSVGQQSSVASRPFKITWDGKAYITDGDFSGNIDAKSGRISGDLEVYGTLTGGTFNTYQLYADRGDIGGWIISRNYLQSPDGITTLYSEAPLGSPNIVTDYIQLHGIDNLGNDVRGMVGAVKGMASLGSETVNMGMYSNTDNIVIFAQNTGDAGKGNVGMRGSRGVYLDGGYNTTTGNGNARILLNPPGEGGVATGRVEIVGSELKVHVDASKQTGIYARFA